MEDSQAIYSLILEQFTLLVFFFLIHYDIFSEGGWRQGQPPQARHH
jgi:hypothetical protein